MPKKDKEITEDTEYYEDSEGTNYEILIGRSDQNNWDIIDKSEQNDLWFHVEGQPSCHVIIKTNGKTKIEKRVINYAASLCKNNSKAKNQRKAKIIYTMIKNVKKADKPGSVHTTRTSIVQV